MHKLVYTVFKTIFLSMMLIFVFDIGFYVFRALSLNQRMESVMTSMQKVVMENNYLPKGDYDMYKTILGQMGKSMNKGDIFVEGIGINYEKNADGGLTSLVSQDATGVNRELLVRKMNEPAAYGDVMVCQTYVRIRQPIWGFGATNNSSESTTYDKYSGQDSTQWKRVGYHTTDFYYTYYVPCLKYQSIQDI